MLLVVLEDEVLGILLGWNSQLLVVLLLLNSANPAEIGVVRTTTNQVPPVVFQP